MNTPDQDDGMPGSELSEPADEDWDSDPGEDVGSDSTATSLVEEVTENSRGLDNETLKARKKSVGVNNVMLSGDNLKIFLGDDAETVEFYRDQYQRQCRDRLDQERRLGRGQECVSLRSLGGQVLDSKVYRVQSLAGCKKRRKMSASSKASLIDNVQDESDEKNKIDLKIPEETGRLSL